MSRILFVNKIKALDIKCHQKFEEEEIYLARFDYLRNGKPLKVLVSI